MAVEALETASNGTRVKQREARWPGDSQRSTEGRLFGPPFCFLGRRLLCCQMLEGVPLNPFDIGVVFAGEAAVDNRVPLYVDDHIARTVVLSPPGPAWRLLQRQSVLCQRPAHAVFTHPQQIV